MIRRNLLLVHGRYVPASGEFRPRAKHFRVYASAFDERTLRNNSGFDAIRRFLLSSTMHVITNESVCFLDVLRVTVTPPGRGYVTACPPAFTYGSCWNCRIESAFYKLWGGIDRPTALTRQPFSLQPPPASAQLLSEIRICIPFFRIVLHSTGDNLQTC